MNVKSIVQRNWINYSENEQYKNYNKVGRLVSLSVGAVVCLPVCYTRRNYRGGIAGAVAGNRAFFSKK